MLKNKPTAQAPGADSNATPPIGKINQFSKIYVTVETNNAILISFEIWNALKEEEEDSIS